MGSSVDVGNVGLLHTSTYSGAAVSALGWTFSTYFTPQAGDVIKLVVTDVSLNASVANSGQIGWACGVSNHSSAFSAMGGTGSAVASYSLGNSNSYWMFPLCTTNVTNFGGIWGISRAVLFMRFYSNGARVRYETVTSVTQNSVMAQNAYRRGAGTVGFGIGGGSNVKPTNISLYINDGAPRILSGTYSMYKLSPAEAAASEYI